jgi:hypothetical protein
LASSGESAAAVGAALVCGACGSGAVSVLLPQETMKPQSAAPQRIGKQRRMKEERARVDG